MLDRINFYDFYGYLLPGLALVVALWVPFAVVQRSWPKGELLSSLVVLAVAYFLGLLLQAIGEPAIPSKDRVAGHERFPSDFQLDLSDPTFSQDAKRKIATKARKEFDIDLGIEKVWDEGVGRNRQSAFFQARNLLIGRRLNTYPEQFQGLYSLMLGLVMACAAGAVYIFGWAASASQNFNAYIAATTIFMLSLISLLAAAAALIRGLDRRPWNRATLVSCGVALLTSGYILGYSSSVKLNDFEILVVLGAVAVFVCLRFYDRYRHFTRQFSKAVWDQYLVSSASGAPNAGDGDGN